MPHEVQPKMMIQYRVQGFGYTLDMFSFIVKQANLATL